MFGLFGFPNQNNPVPSHWLLCLTDRGTKAKAGSKMSNPFEVLEAKLDALATDVRALKSRTMNEKPERQRRVGVKAAAAYCGLAKRTLYKKTHLREIPHSKVGGRLFFDLDVLDAWIDAGKRKTITEVVEERMVVNRSTDRP